MNKVIISISVLLLVIVGALIGMSFITGSKSIYKIAPTTTTTVQDSKDYVVLYSRETCSHCKDLEPDAVNFYQALTKNTDVDFFVYDTGNKDASAAIMAPQGGVVDKDYYMDATHLPENFNVADFKIVGTPTAIHVKDGKIVDISVGASVNQPGQPQGAAELFEKMAKEYNFTYDAKLNN